MKPRNNNEREVEQLRTSLIIRKSDMDWIERCHKVGQTEYFGVLEAKGEWQVIRMFMYRSYSKKNEVLHEPLQYWIKADGSHVIVSKKRQCMGNYYIDSWIVWSDLEIRSNSGSRDVRNLTFNFVRIHSLIPELKRANFRANSVLVKNLMPFWLVQSILTNNRIETFFKLNQTWLTWKFYHYDTHHLTESMWQAIRVAMRHGYHWDNKEEINDWCDMIRDLEYLGLDTRNPHYICPANLQEAHLHWMRKAGIKHKIENRERERKEVEAYEPTFFENRKMFLDMLFVDGKINISIIPTAMGIKDEGIAMHHCVGSYYNRPESLIMSAKINGKRVETIEVNLSSYELIQSRGLQNKSTKYHKRIVNLVNANMNEIRRRNETRRIAV